MKPLLIVQHEADVAPGNLALHLQSRGRPFETVRVHAGDPLPDSAARYAGVCSLGGNMSVNDPLDWIDEEIALMQDAERRGVPILGHCLGGQLLARAFGAPVTRAENLELGWGTLRVDDAAWAREWLGGDIEDVEFFQWHGDSFALPQIARRVLTGAACANQAFVIERPGYSHVGMQFHIEMTADLVRTWAADPAAADEARREIARTGGPAVQTPQQMVDDVERRAERMYRVAARLYDRWLRGVRDA
jgi:GMP synthase-like glutamine amidotransferase